MCRAKALLEINSSNFWFWVEAGVRLPDTQSGFRLYPVQRLKKHLVVYD